MQLLHIDSSVLGAHSASRVLSAAIVARLVALHPGLKVTYHDLGANALPHLSPADVPELAKGNAYIDELFAADVVVIGAPMYNFSVPTQLKAWIDRVTVAGKTFRYGPNGPEGLVLNKKLFIASARGGVYSPGSPAAGVEHQESYLRAVLGFLGLTDVTVVRAEGLAMGPEPRAAAMSKAHEAIAALTA